MNFYYWIIFILICNMFLIGMAEQNQDVSKEEFTIVGGCITIGSEFTISDKPVLKAETVLYVIDESDFLQERAVIEVNNKIILYVWIDENDKTVLEIINKDIIIKESQNE